MQFVDTASGTKILPLIIELACSRRSDSGASSGARAKNKASERVFRRAGKKTRGDWGRGPLPQSPLVFSALSLALFFARAPVSERLEQAIIESYI